MKVIGYTRVSTEDQAKEGVSLEAQQARIEAYSKAKGCDLVGIEADPGLSAKDCNRPGLWEREVKGQRTKEAIDYLKEQGRGYSRA